MDDLAVAELLDPLAELGLVTTRRMFGGVGIYCDGVFFGLIADDLLYFKVDEESVGPYVEAGMEPFRPYPDRPEASMGYYEVPLEVQERPDELRAWAREALRAAGRRDAARAGRGGRRRKA